MFTKSKSKPKIKTKTIMPSTKDKNNKELSEYQKFTAVGLRKHSRNQEMTQQEKMKQIGKEWQNIKYNNFINKSQHLPSYLNERLPW